MHPAIAHSRIEAVWHARPNRVQMRSQQHPLPGPARRQQAHEEVWPTGGDLLEIHPQPVAGKGGEELRHALFAGPWVAGWQERRIHAGQRDQVAEKSGRGSHDEWRRS